LHDVCGLTTSVILIDSSKSCRFLSTHCRGDGIGGATPP
jgi:hypothetical protein